MPEEVLMYEVGDRFGTITKQGRAVIWEVAPDGIPKQASPPPVDPDTLTSVPRDSAGLPLNQPPGPIPRHL